MDQEPYRAAPRLLRRRTPAARAHDERTDYGIVLQFRRIVHLLPQRPHRRGGRPTPPREVCAAHRVGTGERTQGVGIDGTDVCTGDGCTPPTSGESMGNGRRDRLLLVAQHRLLHAAEAVCHYRRVHRRLRIRTAPAGGRTGLGHLLEQVDRAHDLLAHALPLLCQETRRRGEDERDGRGTTKEHHPL